MSTAYVLVEYDGDQVLPITGELITAAKVFESVTAVVVGPAGAHEPLVPQLAALGAERYCRRRRGRYRPAGRAARH